MRGLEREMKRLFVLIMLLPFLAGCSVAPISSETNDIAIDIAASTIGYLIGKEYPDKVDQWIEWGNRILEIEPGLPVDSYEELLVVGIEMSTDDEFLKMQIIKLIRLLDFPELQPPDSLILLEKYVERVKLIVRGFLDGLYATRFNAEVS